MCTLCGALAHALFGYSLQQQQQLTVLQRATYHGDVNHVEMLLRGSTDTRFLVGPLVTWQKPEAGQTALHIAAYRGHPRLCRLLLTAGADVNARLVQQTSTGSEEWSTPLLQTLRGFDETARARHGTAKQKGMHRHAAVARLLLEAGARPGDAVSVPAIVCIATLISRELLHHNRVAPPHHDLRQLLVKAAHHRSDLR